MTRASNPAVFWFEVAAFAFLGLATLAYGLAGLTGYSRFTTPLDIVANRFPILKFKVLLIGALLVVLLASFGWIVVEELFRTSRLRAGGG